MICIITGNPFGGEAGLLGGEASPLPPPVDRTLIHTIGFCQPQALEGVIHTFTTGTNE